MSEQGYHKRINEDLKTEILAALKNFTITGKRQSLVISNPTLVGDVDVEDFATQKKLKLQEKGLGVPVSATIKLIDNETGKIIDQQKQKILNLPVMTPRHSFIQDGTEYQSKMQLRLKPSVYTRVKENGELESQFNLEKGSNFNLTLDPEQSKIMLELGTSSVNAYPLLKIMGVSDSQMERQLGTDLVKELRAQEEKTTTNAAEKMYEYFNSMPAEDRPQAESWVKDFFNNTKMDPEVTKITLGAKYDSVSPQALLSAVKKLVSVSRGETPPDNRENMLFKKTLDVVDILKERVTKKLRNYSNAPLIKYKIDRAPDVASAFPKGDVRALTDKFFLESGLVNSTEQTNPLSMLEAASKVTITGEGGITNSHAITEDARLIHDSQIGLLDPIHTPSSNLVGAVVGTATGAKKIGNSLALELVDTKNGKIVYKTPEELVDVPVGLPDQYTKKGSSIKAISKRVYALLNNKMGPNDAKDVRYYMTDSRKMFGLATNLMPYAASNHANRAQMSSKLLEQAVSLVDRDTPLVETMSPEGRAYVDVIGEQFSFKSPVAGTVSKVTPELIEVADKHGKKHKVSLYHNFPLNRQSDLTSYPKVEVGQKVSQGDLLADTNFTSGGKLALGKTMTVAYLPFKGLTYEDGIVISDSAAKKLTSRHTQSVVQQINPQTVLNKAKYVAYFPKEFTAAQLDTLDDMGVVKEGTVVSRGDPLILVLVSDEFSEEAQMLRKFKRALVSPFKNIAHTWDGTFQGTITNVAKTPTGITVYITAEQPAVVGDKIVSSHANKGIITAVIPDADLPKTATGEVPDIMYSPLSIPSRVNPSQMLEIAAGKIAKADGKPYQLENFNGKNYLKTLIEELKKKKISPDETLYDPKTGKAVGQTLMGPQYTYKLHHVVENKLSSRFLGGYDLNSQPTSPAQNLGMHDMHALLAYGMKKTLKELATYKSERNDEFWRNFQTGGPLPKPKPSFAFDKLMSYFKVLGVNTVKNDDQLVLMPLSDADVLKESKGAVNDSLMVKGKNLEPMKQGLFDENTTGGLGGKNWTHIPLVEPIVNPVYAQPVAHLLDLTKNDVEDVIANKKLLNAEGQIVTSDTSGAMTGSAAIKRALDYVEKNTDMKVLQEQASNAKGSLLNKLHRKLRYLTALKETGLKAADAYMTKNVPVLPPIMRPIFPMDDGSVRVSSLNYLYRDMILANKQLKDTQHLPQELVGEIRLELYKALKALQGLGAPITKLPTRDIRGIMQLVSGVDQAKNGFIQSVVFKRPQELSGRSTITLGLNMHPDEIGIPEAMSWDIFKPFVIKELVSMGRRPNEAIDLVEAKDPIAKQVLDVVSKDRLVLASRAPVLHKFGYQAFKPLIHGGRDIKVHPMVMAGFNSDLDGDTFSIHAPVTPEVLQDSAKALPSRNLIGPKSGELMMAVDKEAALGVYKLTDDTNAVKSDLKYSSIAQMTRDLQDGLILGNELVDLNGKKVMAGKAVVTDLLGLPEMPKEPMSKKIVNSILKKMALAKDAKYADRANTLEHLGFEAAWKINGGTRFEDLATFTDLKEKSLQGVDKTIEKLPLRKAADTLRDTIDAVLKKHIPKLVQSKNSIYEMMSSGARGNMNQFKQMVMAPGFTIDAKNRVIPVPVTSSYAEGLPFHQYWSAMHGGRKGTVETQLATAGPGELYKQALNSLENEVVTIKDCHTTEGTVESLSGGDVAGKYLAQDLVAKGKIYGRRGDLVTTAMAEEAMRAGIATAVVRSPVFCKAEEGVCATCYGLNETGDPVKIGTHVGVIAAHSLTEPLTQMMLSSKHTGGVYTGKETQFSGIKPIKALLTLPRVFPDKATLAKVKGRVEQILKNPAGGWNIYVDGKKHFSTADPTVKVGDPVGRGDPLSNGMMNPRDVLELKGVDSAKRFLAQKIKELYAAGGTSVAGKHVDILSKAMTNISRVVEPGDSEFLPGDIVPTTKIRYYNRNRMVDGDPVNFVGGRLAQDVGRFKEGSLITPNVADELKGRVVKVLKKKIKYKPELSGINMLPLANSEWLSRLNYTHLKDTIMDGAAMRWKTHLHGINPIPAYMYGAEFGDPGDDSPNY